MAQFIRTAMHQTSYFWFMPYVARSDLKYGWILFFIRATDFTYGFVLWGHWDLNLGSQQLPVVSFSCAMFLPVRFVSLMSADLNEPKLNFIIGKTGGLAND